VQTRRLPCAVVGGIGAFRARKPRAEIAAGQASGNESLDIREHAIVWIFMVLDEVKSHCCIAEYHLDMCLKLFISGEQR